MPVEDPLVAVRQLLLTPQYFLLWHIYGELLNCAHWNIQKFNKPHSEI